MHIGKCLFACLAACVSFRERGEEWKYASPSFPQQFLMSFSSFLLLQTSLRRGSVVGAEEEEGRGATSTTALGPTRGGDRGRP